MTTTSDTTQQAGPLGNGVETAPVAPTPTIDELVADDIQVLKQRSLNGYRSENTVAVTEIKLFPTHIEAKVNKLTKTISLANFRDIIDRLLKSSVSMETMALPYNTMLFARSNSTMQLSCYYPGKKLEIKHMNDSMSRAIKKYLIPVPNIIISHTLRNEGVHWLVESTRYFATNKTVTALPENTIINSPDPSNGIHIVPFPNFYGDGRMCYGQNTMPLRFTNNLRGLDYFYQILSIAPFNNDLGLNGVSRNTASSPADWFTKLSKLEEFDFSLLKA